MAHPKTQAAAGPQPPAPRAWLLVLALYLLAGVALTWPLITRFATDLPGGPHKGGLEDAYQNVWNLWWTVRALARGVNPLITDRFFFPEHPNLYYHTLSPINTLLAAPVTALWGPIAGFNTVAMLSFALGGLGMWALARPRVGHGPALLAGLLYVASPFHLGALVSDGQLQIFALQWLPWYVLFLLRAIRDHRPPTTDQRPPLLARIDWRSSLLAGLFLTLTAWTDWYYTLFLLIFTAGAVGWQIVVGGRSSVVATIVGLLPNLAIIGLISAIGAAPLVVPMLVEATRFSYMNYYPADDPARLSADLLAFVVPPRLHALWGGAPWDWGVAYSVNRRFYIGLAVAALSLLAIWRRPASRPWGLMALAFAALALGPELRVNGAPTGLPLPYALIANLPVVRLTRQPDRFDVLVTIALAMLAAHGAAALLDWRGARRGGRAAILAGVAALALLDYWPAPIVTRAPAIPPFLAALPHTDDGALLEYPFHDDVPYRDAERMLFQTVHGRPISGGYHSRLYPQPQLGLPALRDLRAGRLSSDIVAEPGGWPAALQTIGYRYIIGYKQQPLGPQNMEPAQVESFKALVQAGLGVDGPTYEDGWLVAYAVPPADPAPVIGIRAGWDPVEYGADGPPYRWLSDTAELGLIVPTAGIYELNFSARPAGGPRHLQIDLPGGPATIALPGGERRYQLIMALPTGQTVISLRSLEPPTSGDQIAGNGDTRPISVRVGELELHSLESGR